MSTVERQIMLLTHPFWLRWSVGAHVQRLLANTWVAKFVCFIFWLLLNLKVI